MIPSVSIVLPTFDRLGFLLEAVDSVRAQTIRDWELIVVDDGSTDGSVERLETIADPRIQIHRRTHTGHLAQLRNAGIAAARAPWIAFLDSDDRWLPQKLERQLDYHAGHRRFRWSYTGRRFIDAGGRELSQGGFRMWQPHSGWILPRLLTHDANIALPSVMVERTLLLEVGAFDPERLAAEDYDLWLRLAERCECGVVESALLEIRKHKSTRAQLPEVDLAFADMFRRFAQRVDDPQLREVAQTSAVRHAVGASERLGLEGRWSDAFKAIGLALNLRPFAPLVGRACVRLAWRRARAAIGAATHSPTMSE
jgi:glycosyltransferase involved in cell wall biosynthesis